MADPVLHNGWPVDGAPDDERSPIRRAHELLALAVSDDAVPLDVQGTCRDAAIVLSRRLSEIVHAREKKAQREAERLAAQDGFTTDYDHNLSDLRPGESVYKADPRNPHGWTVGIRDADGNTAAGVSIAHAQFCLDRMLKRFAETRVAS